MGSCNSGDYIAEDHIHMDITTCNIKEPQQKYRLGMVSNIILGGGGLKHVLLDPTLALCLCGGSKHLVHMRVS